MCYIISVNKERTQTQEVPMACDMFGNKVNERECRSCVCATECATATAHDAISQELYGVDYASAHMTRL